jgi:hypothetical protein
MKNPPDPLLQARLFLWGMLPTCLWDILPTCLWGMLPTCGRLLIGLPRLLRSLRRHPAQRPPTLAVTEFTQAR